MMPCSCLLLLLTRLCVTVTQEPESASEVVVRVAQSGEADIIGDDYAALAEGLKRLEQGGTLLLGPGRYVLRRTLFPPPGVTIRGEPGAVLALPSPTLTCLFAPAGSHELVLDNPEEFGADGPIGIMPPVGAEFLADGETPGLGPLSLAAVHGDRVVLNRPLEMDVPAGSRISYPIRLIWTSRAGELTLEGLTFEGGRVEEIPLMGHFMHCAIWASPPFGYGEERLGPPARNVVIRHCRFTDWYGRAIALYHVEDSLIEGSMFERIADEAIDLDHFCQRVRVVGNFVRDAVWGIVLNDASRCIVEYNHLEECGIGIHNWWFDKVPQVGINEENVIRHNFVRRSIRESIFLDRTCHRNWIEHNFVDKAIRVVEASNTLEGNTVY